MKKELQEILFKKYPKIFAQRRLGIKKSCMAFGIETGDGWFSLLDTLCSFIQKCIDLNKHLKIPQLEAQQVKEKFGGLRFYTSGGNEKIQGAIDFAEYLSYKICEICGKEGTLCVKGHKKYGWLGVRCPECAKKEDYSKLRKSK